LSPQQIAIYGAGGFGREVAWLVQSCNDVEERYEPVCFIDDNQDLHGSIVNGLHVFGLQQAQHTYPKARIVCGIGIPKTRESIVNMAHEMGFNFEVVIHPRVQRSQWVDIGEGAIICAGNILTTNITIGRHVHINLDCTIGHDVRIGDYSTLAPGVHVSGYVHIGSRVYVGTGAAFVNGTKNEPLIIGDDVTVGAGACVTRPVEPGNTIVGVPARPIGQDGYRG
jgi:sugar O-acyltransferase (sialic acid O-acetyltransferase NeuD family)